MPIEPKTDKYFQTHSVKPMLGTIHENSEFRAPKWGWYIARARENNMRRVPSHRAIEASRIIEASETLVKIKNGKL